MLSGSGRQRTQQPGSGETGTTHDQGRPKPWRQTKRDKHNAGGPESQRCIAVDDRHEQHHQLTLCLGGWKQGGRHVFRGRARRSEVSPKARCGAARRCNAVRCGARGRLQQNRAGVKPTRDSSGMHVKHRQTRTQTDAFRANGQLRGHERRDANVWQATNHAAPVARPESAVLVQARRGTARRGTASDYDSDGAYELE